MEDFTSEWIVAGVGYTPEWVQKYKSNVLEPYEMTAQMAASTIGLPVYIEHDTSVPIGVVHSAYINLMKELMVNLRIYANRTVLQHLLPKLKNRFFRGISAGTEVIMKDAVTRNGIAYRTVDSVRFIEFSIVMSPDRPNCTIKSYHILK